MAETKNIYQKLVDVRKKLNKFDKDATGYGYKYVSGSQVLAILKPELDNQGIILETHLENPIANKGGKGFVVSADMKMVWVNADNPKDRIEIPWYMVGEQKDASQAFGSGLTYTERYFYLKFFGIPTDEDDPDKKENENGKSKSENTNGKDLDALLDLAFTSDKTRKAFIDSFKGTNTEMKKVLTERINKEVGK